MKLWDELYEKLFSSKGKEISHKENFKHTELDEAHISAWMDEAEGKELLDLVYKNYHFKKATINARPQVQIMNSRYANGFVIYFDDPFDENSFSKLFFAFGQRIGDLGYEKISLDRRMREINQQVKITEKQYFKPPFQKENVGQKIAQLYGNISVEKVLFDNKPSYITVLVTVYSDRLYQDAGSFDEFIEEVFKTSHE